MHAEVRGAASRLWDIGFIVRAVVDLVKATRRLHSLAAFITVFGSARLVEGDCEYQKACELGRSLGAAGFSVMTGGGPGLMEAANRGVRASGAASLGCRLDFVFEQATNHHLDRVATVRHFFIRKLIMCRQAASFAILPGGIGTLDELFEILVLLQTKRMTPKPVVLIGEAYWLPLLNLLEHMVEAGTVSRRDLSLITVTDDIPHAVRLLTQPNADRSTDQAGPESDLIA